MSRRHRQCLNECDSVILFSHATREQPWFQSSEISELYYRGMWPCWKFADHRITFLIYRSLMISQSRWRRWMRIPSVAPSCSPQRGNHFAQVPISIKRPPYSMTPRSSKVTPCTLPRYEFSTAGSHLSPPYRVPLQAAGWAWRSRRIFECAAQKPGLPRTSQPSVYTPASG